MWFFILCALSAYVHAYLFKKIARKYEAAGDRIFPSALMGVVLLLSTVGNTAVVCILYICARSYFYGN